MYRGLLKNGEVMFRVCRAFRAVHRTYDAPCAWPSRHPSRAPLGAPQDPRYENQDPRGPGGVFARIRIYPFHTVDYNPLIKSQLASMQSTLGPYVVQTWPRSPQFCEVTKLSKSTAWCIAARVHPGKGNYTRSMQGYLAHKNAPPPRTAIRLPSCRVLGRDAFS